MTRVACLAAVVVLAGGCYNYTPAELTPAPQSGTYLTATLTDSGARALAGYLGQEARAVRGRNLGLGDTGLRLSVTAIETTGGDEFALQGEPVTLPRPFIATIQTRRLAKGRTAMLIGIGIAAIVGTTAGFSLLGKGDSPGQGTGTPNPH